MGRFIHGNKQYTFDDGIHIAQIDSEYLTLATPYNFNGTVIPLGFRWNGASSPNTPLARFIAPKFYKNIKASCVHDYLCLHAKNSADRASADYIYFLIKKYIEKDQPIRCALGLLGVRIGAWLGIGSAF